MKKLTLLISVLALAACGGGSGGGGTPVTPDTVRIPNTVDSDSGLSMIDINAARSENVSQAIRIAESIENDNSDVDYSASARSAVSRPRMAAKSSFSSISQDDIDKAYETMHDIFVNHNYTGYTNHDVLVALALIYMDKTKILEKLGQGNNRLDEKIDNLIDGLQENDDFAKDAQNIYQDFGKHFDLTLENAIFYHNSNDSNWYKFVFDENGKITALKEKDGREYAKQGNGVFRNEYRNGYEYTFSFNKEYRSGQVDVFFDHEPKADELKNAILGKIEDEYGFNSGDMDVIKSLLPDDGLPLISYFSDANYDEQKKEYHEQVENKIVWRHADYTDEVSIKSSNNDNKNLGLKYSDFGLVYTNYHIYGGDDMIKAGKAAGVIKGDEYNYTEHGGFVGGYKDKLANDPSEAMTFTGYAYTGLTRKTNDGQEPKNKYYEGSAQLTVAKDNDDNLKQTIVTDFSGNGWYKVIIEDLNNQNEKISFDNSANNQIHTDWQVKPEEDRNKIAGYHDGLENRNVKYYGQEKTDPTEVVGFVQYIEDHKQGDGGNWTFKADITFGGKRE